MKTLSSLALLLALLPLTANAQDINIYPKKDLAFAQVAAGGGYTTRINVTNRGPNTYSGVLYLFHLTGQPWSPLVNNSQITNGQLNITVNKGATATYDVTGAGGTEAGFAMIRASDLAQTSFLEGTLTFYFGPVLSPDDSVGVQPSSEIYLTAIPFDDFVTLAMALANANLSGVTVKLSVFSETNVRVATLDVPLLSGEHKALYPWQLFPSVGHIRGRLEIQSDPPIFGMILTDIGGQLSSLPFLPAVKAYTFSGTLAGLEYSGEISLWFDGPFVEGYLRALTIGGVPEQNVDTLPLTGSLVNGVLQVTTTGRPDAEGQLLSYLIVNPYSLTQATLQGSATAWFLPSHILAGTGTLTLTAIN